MNNFSRNIAKTVEESVVMTMDGSDKEIFPFLPYILQDLWEIGSDPEAIIKLIKKHSFNYNNLRVLDLGCGKGAVSIKVAREFGCYCYGIDAVPEFISDAQQKAVEYSVDHLCKYEIGDIREKVKELGVYEIIILGSIGPVFGNCFATLMALSKCLSDSGIIIIDSGYIEDNISYTHPLYSKKQTILQQINSAEMKLIENDIFNRNKIKHSNDFIFHNLRKRCLELIDKYPKKRNLFEDYIRKQVEENSVLENKIICTTMVIRRK